MFKLTGFQGKKDSDEIFTSSFYTSPGGYHMAIRVVIYLVKAHMYLSQQSLILEGKNDTELRWPFVRKLLLHTVPQGRHSVF